MDYTYVSIEAQTSSTYKEVIFVTDRSGLYVCVLYGTISSTYQEAQLYS
jgi:hypothetical protein